MFDFTKSRRLLDKKDYDNVFASTNKIVTKEFIVIYCLNKQTCPRLGLVLSKKAINKAHDRNRIKRLFRETFRLNRSLPLVDIIILARRGVANVSNPIMLTKITSAFNKLITSCEH